MRSTVKTLVVLAVAAVLLFLFRTIVFTVYTISDDSLAPTLLHGDRVLVNRWSYGLRVGGNSWISYVRYLRRPVKKGDFIAFDEPVSDTVSDASRSVMIGHVVAVPGDTIRVLDDLYVVPRGCQVCTCDCQSPCIVGNKKHEAWLFVPERDIIGRVPVIIYNFNNFHFDSARWFLPVH